MKISVNRNDRNGKKKITVSRKKAKNITVMRKNA